MKGGGYKGGRNGGRGIRKRKRGQGRKGGRKGGWALNLISGFAVAVAFFSLSVAFSCFVFVEGFFPWHRMPTGQELAISQHKIEKIHQFELFSLYSIFPRFSSFLVWYLLCFMLVFLLQVPMSCQ
ncbi:hypothetical protein B0T21DRAFT_200915 [Apiosordaria backusii]|uniref:Uncharacterized protein n=1 Tax=Apiosordaria backusii TaxID=314023 RepID=A0AA40BEG8_9PEZI|nr:hypothetical protein B0T21DRAFT_200915 [Apiosordaria backusii]